MTTFTKDDLTKTYCPEDVDLVREALVADGWKEKTKKPEPKKDAAKKDK